jgi:hypothetical protein
MTDYFELLGAPRRPWLDPDPLQKAFLDSSARVHPDRVHGAAEPDRREAHERYTLLNTAYQCLRDPKSRLLHLLTLEQGKPPPEVMSIPHETTDLFLEVGARCREADQFLSERAQVASPLLKVAWFERGQDRLEILRASQEKVGRWREELLDSIRSMNPAWESAPPAGQPDRARLLPLQRLEQVYRLLSYADRWSAQLQERAFQMTI